MEANKFIPSTKQGQYFVAFQPRGNPPKRTLEQRPRSPCREVDCASVGIEQVGEVLRNQETCQVFFRRVRPR